jgi:hypothetical protein
MSRTTIVSPVYLGQPHRIEYFKTYMKSCLEQRNFENLDFVFFVEPDFLDFAPIDKLRSYPNVRIMINPFRYGLLVNQYMTMFYCFERLRLEHVIYTEDDCILSNDIDAVTQFYINSKYYDNNTILTYLNKDNLVEPPVDDSGKNILEVKQNYHPIHKDMVYFATWGYLCTAKMWRDCLRKWDHQWCFSHTILPYIKDDFKTVTPKLSRLNHIGVDGASYNKEIYDSHQFVRYMPQNFQGALQYQFDEL